MKRLDEIGKSGVKWSQGYIREEFLTQLRGSRGIKTYREMVDNDAILGACIYAIKQILREARWSVKSWDDSKKSKNDAIFLQDNMAGMSYSWNDFITEALSMFVYGWSFFETVYKKDAKNKIRWKKFAPRLQSALDHWEISQNGTVLGMWQRPAPDFRNIYLPLTKALLFRTELAGDNPEGKSILRPAYRAWYFKKNLEELEGIGVERDLAGIPIVTPPEDFDFDSKEDKVTAAIDWAKKLLQNIRRDEQDGVFLPYGWKLELLSSPGKRQFDTTEIINRYNKEMAVTVLAQFIMLGMERTGSYALAKEQTDMFHLCLEGWLDSIASVVNRYAVPTLFKFNGDGSHELPYLVHTSVRRFSLKDMASYVSNLAKVEGLVIDDDIKKYLTNYARLSEFSEVRR